MLNKLPSFITHFIVETLSTEYDVKLFYNESIYVTFHVMFQTDIIVKNRKNNQIERYNVIVLYDPMKHTVDMRSFNIHSKM